MVPLMAKYLMDLRGCLISPTDPQSEVEGSGFEPWCIQLGSYQNLDL